MGCCQSDDASAEESIPVKGTVPPKNYGSTATAAGASADVAAVAVGDVHVDALANIAAAAASGDAGGSSAAAQSEGDNDASARPLSLEIRAEKAKEREERLKELLGAGANFVKFASKGIFSKSHERRVFVDWKRGTLSYTSETFPIRDVTAIGAGKTFSDVFKRLSESEAPDARCLTVVTKSRTVDLMAESQAVRDTWVEALTFAWHALR